MRNESMKKCCFFGHRKINKTDELVNKLTEAIEKLIVENSVETFLFGSKSQFDDLCYKIVSELKEKHTHIKRVYVRSSFADADESYLKYLLEFYEETYFPEKIRKAGKASYVERNQEMIDKSDYCICYYDENYQPPMRKRCNRATTSYQPKSGSKIAYDYAMKKKINIINIFIEYWEQTML